jgi:hypothetical protein
VVRDLAWCIASPPLLDETCPLFGNLAVTQEWCDQHLERFAPHLRNLAIDPAPLLSWCSSRSHRRLGRYFETLISYWLHHAPGMSDVRQSLQVTQKNQTIGEFDFLFYDHLTQSHYHLEVAVKFYLRDGLGLSTRDYVGPSGIDRLDRKIHLLFEKQLKLGETVAGAGVLQALYGQTTMTSLALVKGMIFEPFTEADRGSLNPAPEVSPRCLQGSWLTLNRITSLISDDASVRWRTMHRPHWLSPMIHGETKDSQDGASIRPMIETHFRAHAEPLMIGMMRYDQNFRAWVETERVLILKEPPRSSADQEIQEPQEP